MTQCTFNTFKAKWRMEMVAQYLADHPRAKNKEIAYACQCSLSTAQRYRTEVLSRRMLG